MWCERCHKNVAGTLSCEHESICCAHCGTPLPGGLQMDQASTVSEASTFSPSPLPCPEPGLEPAIGPAIGAAIAAMSEREPLLALESWEMDEDLRHMQRLLRGRRFADAADNTNQLRCDASHSGGSAKQIATRGWLTTIRSGIAKTTTLVGTTTLACGLALLAWWHFAARADLCAPGLICTIAGQFLLLLGIMSRPGDPRSAAAQPTIPGLSDHPLLYAELSKELSEATSD
jgi:hypothetical protein